MALDIEKLNGDSTFLVAFAPAFAPTASKSRKLPGAFTILIDPWLDGHSSILHPSFQISHHTTTCAVASLADLAAPPDLIIISQDKPDHCHQATLTSLPPHWSTQILAVSAAAKKIRSWEHFNPDAVHVLPTYNPERSHSVIRIRLDPYTSTSSPGEITIAHVPTKRDITGVHNAIGITYRPPGSLFTALDSTIVHLEDMIPSKDSSPSRTKRLRKSKSAFRVADAFRNSSSTRRSSIDTKSTRSRSISSPSPPVLDPIPPLPPLVRVDSKNNSIFPEFSIKGSPLPSLRTPSPPAPPPPTTSRTHLERTLSIVYTPHGLASSALEPYIENHLRPSRALPLTALFHSLTTEANPWFMGGIVANGAPGGVDLVASLGGEKVKCWVGAHDEEKRHMGLATKWLRTRRWKVDEVMKLLGDKFADNGDVKIATEVKVLDVGERIRI